MTEFTRQGYRVFPKDPRVSAWATAARPIAEERSNDPAARAKWLRHGGTWFVGVDSLPNGEDGSVNGVPLSGPWEDLIAWKGPWHRAQVSVTFPGYPGRDPDEPETAHRYRVTRDAAHIDGLLPEGPNRRRHLREPHAFVLGLPLAESDGAPLVVWEGSHHIMGAALSKALQQDLNADITDIYAAARKEVFANCPRHVVKAIPGQSILLHRHLLHGISPWNSDSQSSRMVAYFRPQLDTRHAWLKSDDPP